MEEEKKEEKNNNSKQILLAVLGVAVLIVAVVGVSFAVFSYYGEGQVVNTISTGTITMSFNEPENGISIENAVPITEEEGKVLSGDNEKFDFTVTCKITGSTTVNYEVVAVKDETSTISDDQIRLYLESSSDGATYAQKTAPTKYVPITEKDSFGAPVGSMVIDSGSFTASSTQNSGVEQKVYYRLRMWVDSSYNVTDVSSNYKVKVNVYGKGVN